MSSGYFLPILLLSRLGTPRAPSSPSELVPPLFRPKLRPCSRTTWTDGREAQCIRCTVYICMCVCDVNDGAVRLLLSWLKVTTDDCACSIFRYHPQWWIHEWQVRGCVRCDGRGYPLSGNFLLFLSEWCDSVQSARCFDQKTLAGFILARSGNG